MIRRSRKVLLKTPERDGRKCVSAGKHRTLDGVRSGELVSVLLRRIAAKLGLARVYPENVHQPWPLALKYSNHCLNLLTYYNRPFW